MSTSSSIHSLFSLQSNNLPSNTRILDAINAMQEGRPVILLDDSDRENEADLIIAAEKITVETMALLIRECSGIVCLCIPDELITRLQLPMMPSDPTRSQDTAFTVSIDARHNITTGVSATDRVTTIKLAISDNVREYDLVKPGHVFPLRAQPGGVLTRRGHTEGAVDLAILAGLKPAAVLCELMNPDGTMARYNDVENFSKSHDLPILTIEELVHYRSLMEETLQS